jgi:hypothetical protein
LKRIFIVFALCLVSFQSYAESEMTFKEFGDVVYSEDKSAWFMRYTDTAVKQQKVMKELRYSSGKYGFANGFRDACLAKCVGEEKCGGVVFQYYDSKKDTLKQCAFKKLEPTTKTNKQKKKDFYKRICYAGGPFTFPHPDPERAASLQQPLHGSCGLFGKIEVKTADGSIVAPDCNDGEPYTKANDPACQAAGKTACWDKGWSTGDQSSPWVVGYVQSRYDANKLERRYDNCFRECAVHDQCYSKGANFYDGKYDTRWSAACDGGVSAAVHDLGFDKRYPLENSSLVPLAAACYVY